MKKKLLFLSLSVLAIAAIVTVKSVNTKSGMSSLMTQNIEALTQNENPMDKRIWYVDAQSSTQWTCTPNGYSACPAPSKAN